MTREITPPTRKEVPGIGGGTQVEETHPAFGMIGVSHMSVGPKGASLFDSDILHNRTVRIAIRGASRRRDLNRDWIHGEKEIIEVEMSEAQFGAFVSSPGQGDGVPCTIRHLAGEGSLPDLPHEPRLHESISEVEGAAEKAFEKIKEAFAAVEEKPTKRNIRSLRAAIDNAPGNVAFAGKSLTEHAENVVQKARADVEAMVISRATEMGLNPGDLGDVAQLSEGETTPDD